MQYFPTKQTRIPGSGNHGSGRRMRDSICIGIREWMPIMVLPLSSQRQAMLPRSIAFILFKSPIDVKSPNTPKGYSGFCS